MHLTKNKTSNGHINAISGSGGDHLVIVQQTVGYAAKFLVATPIESKFALAYAYGMESNPTLAYTSNADADALVARFEGALHGASWNNGQKALFFCYSRGGMGGMGSPRRMAENHTDYHDYTEFLGSAVALKFDLRQLPLDGMTVNAYIRAYCPSLLIYDSAMLQYATAPSVFSAHFCKQLEYRFYETLPSNCSGVGGNDTNRMDLYGIAAAGSVVANPMIYSPYGYNGSWSGSLTTGVHPGWRSAAQKYYDFEITSNQVSVNPPVKEAGLDFLKAGGRSEIWLVAKPRIARPAALEPYDTLFGYIQRLELVLKVTGPAYNNT